MGQESHILICQFLSIDSRPVNTVVSWKLAEILSHWASKSSTKVSHLNDTQLAREEIYIQISITQGRELHGLISCAGCFRCSYVVL